MSEHMLNFRGLVPAHMTNAVAASNQIERGNFVGLDANGRCVEGTTAATCKLIVGQSLYLADNTTGAAGAIDAQAEYGVHEWINSSTDAVTNASSLARVVYCESEATVAKTSGGGQLVPAGIMTELTAAGKVAVFSHPIVAALADMILRTGPRFVRSVIPTNLAATNVAGVLTANANGALSAQDGVTLAVGDRVLVAGQTTAADCGIYVVTSLGSAGTPFVLARVADMPNGAAYINGQTVEVSEGTVFAGSTWKAMCTGSKVIGTDDPLFYPRVQKKTITLAAGTYTYGAGGGGEPCFLFSTTTSAVEVLRNTANTSTATTGGYASPVASRIAGKAGTGAVLVQAQVAAGTINNADLSTLDLLITNW